MAIDRNDPQQERLVSVRTAIEPVLRAHAVELADVMWTSEHGGLTLRVTIERPLPEGTPWRPELGFGVNLDDCADVSRDVSTALDAIDDTMPEAYSLEVSSPGLDRPLHGARDFVRFTGNTVKVKLAKPATDGQRLLRGTLVEANDEAFTVVVDGKRVEAALADVAEAQLVFELIVGQKASERQKAGGEKAGPKPAKTKANEGRSPDQGGKPAARAKRTNGSRAG